MAVRKPDLYIQTSNVTKYKSFLEYKLKTGKR